MGSLGFEAALAVCPAAAQAYSKYCGIVSGCENANTREGLVELSRTIDNMEGMRDGIFGDIQKLMSVLELDDARQFSNFYDFVFFISRENGQKNITVQKAVAAWRIVLIGRFRLLDRWCNFVEKYQRHNISEDAWQQLLAFSRCVNEDLEGYDPKGAWPVIIDDFVEYMHRIYRPGDCSSAMASQCSISNTFRGLNLLPGSKRKCPTQFNSSEDNVELSDVPRHSLHLTPLKRLKESSVSTKSGVSECNAGTPFLNSSSDCREDTNLHNSRGWLQNSPCIVEDSLAKGFEGCISMKCSFC
ncbi:defective in cullin neddylation protein AAR3 isoform X2 [Lolium rigidum]|jgi:DCN1-like protein 1/2|uniref:defective in cullin neddylation protein AAR3 isoform X2 n=1 Tax=Lolium rigidum TaxID=89674 RepID=UPI001F5D0DFC|nr:defective in cullin neddylation protein AAR3 isoform X2 [Lolium rigidum]XP_051214246.1 defective in cullin neddylation protein AAR3 isoform X4 [Lolium perenne]